MIMKGFIILILSLLSLASCGRTDVGKTASDPVVYGLEKPVSQNDAFSYVYGYMLAASASGYADTIDYHYMAKGVLDYMSGTPFFTPSEMERVISGYQRTAAAEAQAELEEEGRLNLQAAEEFLLANGHRSGVMTTDSGIQYEVLEKGSGKEAGPDSSVRVNYILTLLDGRRADSSYERGEPTALSLPDTIAGFREAVAMMREGDRYRFWIPPELGYAEAAVPGIPPGSLLIFDISLVEVL